MLNLYAASIRCLTTKLSEWSPDFRAGDPANRKACLSRFILLCRLHSKSDEIPVEELLKISLVLISHRDSNLAEDNAVTVMCFCTCTETSVGRQNPGAFF